jgi:GT2 family glycosyltransferase
MNNKMNISLVLAVYNKLELTKNCYKSLRKVYPKAPLVISSGGSSDGTKEWLESLKDDNLSFFHDDTRLTFSETYNAGIDLVDTEKLVLIHNDMVIGKHFLENLDRLLDENPNTLLSYTTIEPPIFAGHQRPGKVILDMGTGFDNFNQKMFNKYVKENKDKCKLYDGAVFFMSGRKDMFIDLGGFDGFSFVPCFCEDDDFLIRAKLKGYKLKTTECAITYHFVSQTSRFSDEMKDKRQNIEIFSNRNFVRKWGIPISTFNQIGYQTQDKFTFKKFLIGITINDDSNLTLLEPFFDKIDLGMVPQGYIDDEQSTTRYDLKSKFENVNDVDVMISLNSPLTQEDFNTIVTLQVILSNYDPGHYNTGNLSILIKDQKA